MGFVSKKVGDLETIFEMPYRLLYFKVVNREKNTCRNHYMIHIKNRKVYQKKEQPTR